VSNLLSISHFSMLIAHKTNLSTHAWMPIVCTACHAVHCRNSL